MSNRSLEKLGQELHQRLRLEHSAFHSLAGQIAQILNSAEQNEHLPTPLTEFTNHSKSLSALMQNAKKELQFGRN